MDRTIESIRLRLAELERRIVQAELGLREMQDERAQIANAIHVYDRFADEDSSVSLSGVEPDLEKRRASAAQDTQPHEPVKLAAMPPLPELILRTLADAQLRGENSLTPREIGLAIRTSWPTARFESISSVAWRMAKDGRLHKDDGRYSTPAPPSGELFKENSTNEQKSRSSSQM